MRKPEYTHLVDERSTRGSRSAAFEVLEGLEFSAPSTRTLCSDEPTWRRVWRLDDSGGRYAALSAHIVAAPNVADPDAGEIELLLIASLTRELGSATPDKGAVFDGLATATRKFASDWVERLG